MGCLGVLWWFLLRFRVYGFRALMAPFCRHELNGSIGVLVRVTVRTGFEKAGLTNRKGLRGP